MEKRFEKMRGLKRKRPGDEGGRAWAQEDDGAIAWYGFIIRSSDNFAYRLYTLNTLRTAVRHSPNAWVHPRVKVVIHPTTIPSCL